ncbi:hypothetical protein Salat_0206200 [Sesamum alatum]|uniref:Uncharacterized protein n=1 Tax=Sesamum alatum TaxID=300844 RepID=A0AAE1YYP0_9LAMI|nr:hypothetical protein Salat_0206200 [Sesamum alatum]
MSLRHQVLVDFPDPNYAKYGVAVEANVEPQTELNVEKGKGVDVEDGDLNDFADAEWDEVFKIVDSYAKGRGQRKDELKSHNEVEQSDRLFDEGLEDSEYEMDDDEESGSVAKKAKGKAMAPSNNEQDNSNSPGSQTMIHRFTQCSTSAVGQLQEVESPISRKEGGSLSPWRT